jgi:hypothetical protein
MFSYSDNQLWTGAKKFVRTGVWAGTSVAEQCLDTWKGKEDGMH